jgi:hypothetical protein
MEVREARVDDLAQEKRSRFQIKNLRMRTKLRIAQLARRQGQSVADWLDWAVEVAEQAQLRPTIAFVQEAREAPEPEPLSPPGGLPDAAPPPPVELAVAVSQLVLLVQILAITDTAGSPGLVDAMMNFTQTKLREIAARLSRLCPDEPVNFDAPAVPPLLRGPEPRFRPRVVKR